MGISVQLIHPKNGWFHPAREVHQRKMWFWCEWISTYGYGSIPISTIFRVMNIHKSQPFWGSLGVQGFDPLPYRRWTPNVRRLRRRSIVQRFQKGGLVDDPLNLEGSRWAPSCCGKMRRQKTMKIVPCKLHNSTRLAHTQITHPTNIIYLSPEDEWK